MKKGLTILFFFIVQFMAAKAQDTAAAQYLFNDYQEALILYKDGRQFTAPVNFDLLNGHYLFIDAKDKQPKQFANPEMIALIRIGSRSFLLEEGGATEVIQTEPLFRVTYSGNLRQAPKNISYGGTTQTAAVDTYSGYSAGGGTLGAKRQSSSKMVVGIIKNYEAQIGKKKRRFHNRRTFLKAYPKMQRPTIEEYIDRNEVDFENIQQVLDLYKYTENRFSIK